MPYDMMPLRSEEHVFGGVVDVRALHADPTAPRYSPVCVGVLVCCVSCVSLECFVQGGEAETEQTEVVNMVAIPLIKLFSLTVKTLAKPMSKKIKTGESSIQHERHSRTAGPDSAAMPPLAPQQLQQQ